MRVTTGSLTEGLRGSFPLVPSVFVYATVWGGLARQAGLSLGEIALMCLMVTELRQVESLPPKERKQVLQFIETLVERETLKKKR